MLARAHEPLFDLMKRPGLVSRGGFVAIYQPPKALPSGQPDRPKVGRAGGTSFAHLAHLHHRGPIALKLTPWLNDPVRSREMSHPIVSSSLEA